MPYTLTYSLTINQNNATIDLSMTTVSGIASIAVNQVSTTGNITVDASALSSIVINITAQDGATFTIYTLTVYRISK